ncbi:MAG TPA: amino acid transporter [Blastocatellia bacterium]|nr:amino acid transporter [Blastocatellia bacterium]
MCLTGVDYFSTLGYQPGIAFLAAGALSPVATLILVMLTLFGALPIYGRVAQESPHGEGSISMLENLLPRWRGKLFVLALLGFVTTDFVITMTLSAADATAHIIENPLVPRALEHYPVLVTLALLAVLGALFLKGFKEAIGLAVVLVFVYLALNVVVVVVGIYEVITHAEKIPAWRDALFAMPNVRGNPLLMVGVALILFPKLALGLSGFETGVAVMPLVKGEPSDDAKSPAGRIRNTRKLLLTAALIMSVMLIASSVVTTLLIPAHEFAEATGSTPKGAANGRALAYLAHHYFGNAFGTVYDLSTILILWFAGASAMAGLLNIVPRYLPRYGMAPDWTRAIRPLTLVFTAVAFAVTIIFNADVNAQGGAYATGVLALMSSAAVAVTLSAWREGPIRYLFLLIALVFAYTTVLNIYERPEGIKIASIFIGAIVLVSFISRAMRSTELRVERVDLNDAAREFLEEVRRGTIRIIANRPDRGDADEYRLKEKQERWNNHIPANDPVLFLEVRPGDVSEFAGVLRVRGVRVGSYRVLRTKSPAVPNALAAFLLQARDETGQIPHIYFGWTEGNPIWYLVKFILFGEGDTAPVTHEILRKAEPDPTRRPAVHVGG